MKHYFNNKEFSLVLSGGGALGLAHLGVLVDMEKLGLEPSEIVGTSMGGIIGACVSIRMKEIEIYKLFKEFLKLAQWVKFSFGGNAMIDSAKIEKIFDKIFKDKKMKDTNIPLKIITTELTKGDKRVFDKNDDVLIKDAILATMAIPGIFEERMIEGKSYGDGFLCENLGISEVKNNDVLAVDVLGSGSFTKELPDKFFKTSNIIGMFDRSMRIIIYNQTKSLIELSDKKITLLELKTYNYKTFNFNKLDEIRELGLGLLIDSMANKV